MKTLVYSLIVAVGVLLVEKLTGYKAYDDIFLVGIFWFIFGVVFMLELIGD